MTCDTHNIVGWFEIYVGDMDRARKFYETIFSLPLEKLDAPEMEMWAFPWKDKVAGAGGALVKMDGVSPGACGTMVYFMCEDCAFEEGKIVANGGEVLRSKFSIGPHGFIAIVKDTEGNVIGLHSMK